MTELPITLRTVVYPWQMDHMDHLNVQHYAALFDQSTWVLFGLLGLTAPYFREHRCGMAALDQHTRYLRELHAGDRVENRSGVLEVREKTVRFFHRMIALDSGALAATTVLTGVFLDTQARKGLPLPAFVRDSATPLLVPESAVTQDA